MSATIQDHTDAAGEEIRERLLRVTQRAIVADLDRARTLKEAYGSMTQSQMSRVMGLTQSAISQALKKAEGLPEVVPGFAGATVMEVCRRFAAGELSREELVRQLVEWPYVPSGDFDEFGDYSGPDEGTFEDVVTAEHQGLIDSGVYAAVLEGLSAGDATDA